MFPLSCKLKFSFIDVTKLEVKKKKSCVLSRIIYISPFFFSLDGKIVSTVALDLVHDTRVLKVKRLPVGPVETRRNEPVVKWNMTRGSNEKEVRTLLMHLSSAPNGG